MPPVIKTMLSVTEQWGDIAQQLAENAKKVTRQEIEYAAKEGARYLKQNSPVSAWGSHKGSYSRGWRSSVEEPVGTAGEAYIYNKTDYQLTHLLEDGHAIKNRYGGPFFPPYGGIKHIYYAEGHVYDILDQRLNMRISRGLY